MNILHAHLLSELKTRLNAIEQADQSKYPFYTESQLAGFANLGMWAAWHSSYVNNATPEILEVAALFGECFGNRESQNKLISLGKAIVKDPKKYEAIYSP